MGSLCNSAEGQILNVSSSAHFLGKIHWEDFSIEKRWFGFRAYGQSKLLLNLFTFELADKMRGTNIRVNAIHPGIVKTNLSGNKEIKKSKTLENFMSGAVTTLGISPERSAQAIVNMLMEEKYKHASGKYFSLDKVRRPSLRSQNKKNQRKLWDKTYQFVDQSLTFNSIFDVIEVCH
jgi:NAD(P)-dependent dehydrogenase (short-subunit alcohol dehydrogenase family)